MGKEGVEFRKERGQVWRRASDTTWAKEGLGSVWSVDMEGVRLRTELRKGGFGLCIERRQGTDLAPGRALARRVLFSV